MVILTSFQQPESPILYEQINVKAVLDSKELGVGSLVISERTLCWKEPGGLGFSIEYPHVSMHAITRDPLVYHSECVLVTIDQRFSMPGFEVQRPERNNDDDDDDDDTDSESEMSLLVLVPPDSNSINSIYTTLNQCQLLNPDPEDIMVEDDEDNFYEDAEECEDVMGRLNDFGAEGDTEMNHLATHLRNHSINTNFSYGNGDQNFDDDQFEDAD